MRKSVELNKRTSNRDNLLWVLIVIPYLALIPAIWYYNKILKDVNNASIIVISKQNMNLKLFNYKGQLLQTSKIACGKNEGDKNNVGDMKTPEGVFNIADIEDAATWTHDFKDGNGVIKGAYGPYFIRINIPGKSGIGIHGTHDENSLGKRVTEGCIRLKNDDLQQLVKHVSTSSVVVITPGINDVKANMDSVKYK